MARMHSILKDPLLHFLALGLAMFIAYEALAPDNKQDGDPKRITVDRGAMLTFLQYRTKTFQPKLAAARLDAMSAEQLQKLVKEYIREEALYRESQALGLERNDYIIKRRMIQKVEFITQGFAKAGFKFAEKDVLAFYQANKTRFVEPAFITFTHVFFDASRRGPDSALAAAKAKLADLNDDGAVFSDAPKFGDRFPYGVNYVERSREHVASHFGKEATKALFTLEPADGQWRGPFKSTHGVHLVMVIKKQAERTPPLAEVRNRIASEMGQEQVRNRTEKAIAAIVKTYAIKVDLDGKAGETLAQAKQAQ